MSIDSVYVVRIGRRQGKRYAERHPIAVPLDLATGNYERLSDEQLTDALNTAIAEQMRREGLVAAKAAGVANCNGYDPAASQMGRDS